MGNFKKTLLIVIAAGAMALAGLFYIVPAFRGDIEVRGEWFIGPVRLSVYGLLFALAIVLGYALVRRGLPRVGLARSVADDVILWLVVGGLMGARIYHVFFSLDYYRAHWLEAIEIYRGGLSIYGAMAGGIVAMILFARWKKIDLLRSLDVVALVLPLAQSLGRWGNFFNREAFGLPTDLPWKLYIPGKQANCFFAGELFSPHFFIRITLGPRGVLCCLASFERELCCHPRSPWVYRRNVFGSLRGREISHREPQDR